MKDVMYAEESRNRWLLGQWVVRALWACPRTPRALSFYASPCTLNLNTIYYFLLDFLFNGSFVMQILPPLPSLHRFIY